MTGLSVMLVRNRVKAMTRIAILVSSNMNVNVNEFEAIAIAENTARSPDNVSRFQFG
jgi:hypothetical protein